MDKLAIDIVLLPPSYIMDEVIAINNQFSDDPIKLHKKNCIPHISLCMGVIKKKDIPKIQETLQNIINKYKPLSLTINKINKRRCSFDIEKNTQLQCLHEEIMTQLNPYLSYDATVDMCYPPVFPDKKALVYINNYKNVSFDNFYPHITLGTSEIEEKKTDISFVGDIIAICHLGTYCTCREVLFETKLI